MELEKMTFKAGQRVSAQTGLLFNEVQRMAGKQKRLLTLSDLILNKRRLSANYIRRYL